jgi:anti-sigma factor RsiW
MFMKTFEEKWTAWIDDQLTGRELEEFEASLPDKAAAQAEKQSAKQLGSLLREQMAPLLNNAEFFSHQLRERLDREERRSLARPISTGWWTIRRLLWSGATALAIFVICAVMVIRSKPSSDQSEYLTQILNYRVDPVLSPNATITMFEKKDEHVTVLWVDGLQSLPPEYASK